MCYKYNSKVESQTEELEMKTCSKGKCTNLLNSCFKRVLIDMQCNLLNESNDYLEMSIAYSLKKKWKYFKYVFTR